MVNEEWLREQRDLKERRELGVKTRPAAEDQKNLALRILNGEVYQADLKNKILDALRIAQELQECGWLQQARTVHKAIGRAKKAGTGGGG